jgi:hypothetical protein
MAYSLHAEQSVAAPVEKVFDFFTDVANLSRVTPPFVRLRILSRETKITARGQRLEYEIGPLILRWRWVSEITDFDPPFRFVDEQVAGPYRRWQHVHQFYPLSTGTLIVDDVTYDVPFGPLGRIVHGLVVRRHLEAIFAYRQVHIERFFDRTDRSR